MANNQVGQVKDQVGKGQGQGQELDNFEDFPSIFCLTAEFL